MGATEGHGGKWRQCEGRRVDKAGGWTSRNTNSWRRGRFSFCCACCCSKRFSCCMSNQSRVKLFPLLTLLVHCCCCRAAVTVIIVVAVCVQLCSSAASFLHSSACPCSCACSYSCLVVRLPFLLLLLPLPWPRFLCTVHWNQLCLFINAASAYTLYCRFNSKLIAIAALPCHCHI